MPAPQFVDPTGAQEAAFNQQRAWIQGQFNGVTYMPNNMDVQHEPLYDTLNFSAGAQIPNNSTFFTAPTGKTYAQTNVKEASKLQAPQAMSVKGIGFFVVPTILLADLTAILNPQTGYALEFWIGEKSYNRAPLWFYVPGGGISGFTSQTDTSFYNNGMVGRNERHLLAINIIIDNQASFYGNLVSAATAYTLTAAGSGGTGATFMMVLDGLHARGVQ